jgi:hypothetical protein
MGKRAVISAGDEARQALDKRLSAARAARQGRAQASAVGVADASLHRIRCAQGGEVLPDWVARLPEARRAKIRTLADAEEYASARDRVASVKAMERELARRTDTANMDAFTAMARGLVMTGRELRALAPTRQLAELGTGRGKNSAVLTRKHLAAACAWHQLWLETRYGAASVDPGRVKVDGGGGGDAELGMIRAADSARRLKRLRSAVAGDGRSGPIKADLLVWVIEQDEPLKNFSIARLVEISGENQLHGARILLLTDGLEVVARQLGY